MIKLDDKSPIKKGFPPAPQEPWKPNEPDIPQ